MSALAMKRVPSDFVHPVYELKETEELKYGEDRITPRGDTVSPEPEANLVSSQIVGRDGHTPMLDIDIPAFLIPSSTPGHSHLYIELEMPWRKYKRLMKELARAGIIEEGYYKASVQRKHSALRLRGVKKPTPSPAKIFPY